ncbi:hypothetical protein BDV98DRAFT_624220 [Pterulicium gracile]|uniref:Uncharacterized protein n=1 Tax=Pterulicium gracile TaxID=1884261 RepID=A0A5C3R0F2_9AGAR|nr:hypothetical protein BDV98DRAFT_624220 [Pterula gracilis]
MRGAHRAALLHRDFEDTGYASSDVPQPIRLPFPPFQCRPHIRHGRRDTPPPVRIAKNALVPHPAELDIDFNWPEGLDHEPGALFRRKTIRDILPRMLCPNVSTIQLSTPNAHVTDEDEYLPPDSPLRDNDVQAVQRLILASGAQSTVRSIFFKDLEDGNIAEHLVTLLTKLPCLQSPRVEVSEDRHINYNSHYSSNPKFSNPSRTTIARLKLSMSKPCPTSGTRTPTNAGRTSLFGKSPATPSARSSAFTLS